jgi:hypothetical protein
MTTVHRLSSTGILQTTTPLDETGIVATPAQFANNAIFGVLDEVTLNGSSTPMRLTPGGNILLSNIYDETLSDFLPPSAGLYDFTSFTFTNATATGRTGPSLANCLSSYNTTTNSS